MEENKTMSVQEVLGITINVLEGIHVPVALMDQISVPIRGCIQNIRNCLQAIDSPEHATGQEPIFDLTDALMGNDGGKE